MVTEPRSKTVSLPDPWIPLVRVKKLPPKVMKGTLSSVARALDIPICWQARSLRPSGQAPPPTQTSYQSSRPDLPKAWYKIKNAD